VRSHLSGLSRHCTRKGMIILYVAPVNLIIIDDDADADDDDDDDDAQGFDDCVQPVDGCVHLHPWRAAKPARCQRGTPAGWRASCLFHLAHHYLDIPAAYHGGCKPTAREFTRTLVSLRVLTLSAYAASQVQRALHVTAAFTVLWSQPEPLATLRRKVQPAM
jgi:hypothetical protein